MKDENKKKDEGIGPVGIAVGAAGLLALSAFDGGLVTLAGCGALAYGTWRVATAGLQPDEDPKPDSDRAERDLGILEYGAAGACAVATFLNPFIGIPGTLVLLYFASSWRQDMRELVNKEQAKREKRKNRKSKAKIMRDLCLG